MIDTLFWCITAPSIYIAVACLTYKILRKIFFTELSEIENAQACAAFWFFTVPVMVVILVPYWVFTKLFEMIEGGENQK